MTKKYQINAKNQRKHLESFAIMLVMSVAGVVIIGLTQSPSDAVTYFIVFGGMSLLQLVPLCVIHRNYIAVNRKDVLEYDNVSKNCTFLSEGVVVNFNIDEIKSAIYYKSHALDKKDIQLLSWDVYNHVELYVDANTKLVLTSLMFGGEIKLPIDENKVTKEIWPFRFVKGRSIERIK